MKMTKTTVSFRDACDFVKRHHRHHVPPRGHKFSIGAIKDGALVGVVIVGRPVARHRDDGDTLEVTRLCTDGTRNACSYLYQAAARASAALGYSRLGTYIQVREGGVSLRAAGWRKVYETKAQSWDCPSRPREDKTEVVARELWETEL